MQVEGLEYITTWLAKEQKVLPILKTVMEQIRIGIDGRGTGWHGTPSAAQMLGTPATSTVFSATVPGNKIWYIPWACAFHDDPVAKNLTIFNQLNTTIGAVRIYVKDGQNCAQYMPLSTNRPIVIHPNGQLGAETIAAAPAAGRLITLRFVYYEMDPGDYVLT